MPRLMIVFDTAYGQTRKIAEYVGEVAANRGHAVRVIHVLAVSEVPLGEADGFVVLAPILDRRLPASILQFVDERRSLLTSRPSAFFCVSMGAATKIRLVSGGVRKIADDFLRGASWRPDVVASVAGALAYPSYRPWLRFTMRLGARAFGLPTDTSRVHELTDWNAVKSKTLEVLDLVERRCAADHETSRP